MVTLYWVLDLVPAVKMWKNRIKFLLLNQHILYTCVLSL